MKMVNSTIFPRRIATTILISIAASVASLFGYQVLIAVESKGTRDTAQDGIRIIARHWASKSNVIGVSDIRSPIGLSTLGCRIWALDFIRSRCYSLIIYADTPPPAEWRNGLADAIASPCTYKEKLQVVDSKHVSENFNCEADSHGNFRAVISIQKVHRFVSESGHAENRFEEIDRIVIRGRM